MSILAGDPSEAWDPEGVPEGVEDDEFGFLAALLIRFPDIASVQASAEGSELSITFLLESRPDPRTLAAFGDRLNRSLATLTRVLGDRAPRTARVSARSFKALASLQVVRSLDTAAAEEFPILHGMVTETFGKSVIVESPGERCEGPAWSPAAWSPAPEGEEAFPLEYSLRQFKASGAKGQLYGFRDGARVLVYRS